jgi:hypothetical protein
MLSLGKQLPMCDFRLLPRSKPLKMGPIGSPETSNYHYSLRNNPEKRSSHLVTDVQCFHHQCPTLGFFETEMTIYPMKERHILDDISLQESSCVMGKVVQKPQQNLRKPLTINQTCETCREIGLNLNTCRVTTDCYSYSMVTELYVN